MTKKAEEGAGQAAEKPWCFAIMPISDQQGYDAGHFGEVYEDIIVPALEQCGYESIRADQVSATNLIQLDILKKILEAPLAICDLSAANPNVMFELGIRQAFDKPVVLLKDTATRKIFDIDSLRTVSYNADLSHRGVKKAIADLCSAINATRDAKPNEGINSIVGLLNLHAAAMKANNDDPASARMTLIENSLGDLADGMKQLQNSVVSLSSSKKAESSETVGPFERWTARPIAAEIAAQRAEIAKNASAKIPHVSLTKEEVERIVNSQTSKTKKD